MLENYRSILLGHYLDGTDGIHLFLEKCSSSRILKDASVFVDGFDILPIRMMELIIGLASVCKQVTVTCTLCDTRDPDREIFSALRKNVFELLSMADLHGIPYRDTYLPRKKYASSKLSYLEQNLFARESVPYPELEEENDARALQLASARNPLEEAAITAGEIMRLVRDHGYRYRQRNGPDIGGEDGLSCPHPFRQIRTEGFSYPGNQCLSAVF